MPLSQLPTLEAELAGVLHVTEEIRRLGPQARVQPYMLDDAPVDHVARPFADRREMLPLYEEQLRRWSLEHVSDLQRATIDQMRSQVRQLREDIEDVLAIAAELTQETIEGVLAMDDVELGMRVLMGDLRLPDAAEPSRASRRQKPPR